MPKYVALPCPPQPIVAHDALALDDISRAHHEPEKVEIEHLPPELPEEERPRYAYEWGNAGVANEVRYIRITSPTSTSAHTVRIRAHQKMDLRAGNLIRKRKRTLHRSQIKQMNLNDKILAEFLHTTPFCFSFTTGMAQKKSRHVILEQLE